jgi:hypothetical protein
MNLARAGASFADLVQLATQHVHLFPQLVDGPHHVVHRFRRRSEFAARVEVVAEFRPRSRRSVRSPFAIARTTGISRTIAIARTSARRTFAIAGTTRALRTIAVARTTRGIRPIPFARAAWRWRRSEGTVFALCNGIDQRR